MIRKVKTSDAAKISEIDNYYIENTYITFEVEPVSEEYMSGRVEECLSNNLPWLVAEHENEVVGYCYASKWKGRCSYRHSIEATVYLDASATSQGWGSRLYAELLHKLAEIDVYAVICGIALPNAASVALHEKFGMEEVWYGRSLVWKKFGMKKVAHFKEVGRKFENWVDVGYWQCLLRA